MRYLFPGSGEAAALEYLPQHGDPQKFTFAELSDWTHRYASLLHAQGVRKGDRVCLYLPNSPQLIVSLFGNHLLGAITVPVNPAATVKELSYVAQSAEVSALVSEAGLETPLQLHLRPRDYWETLRPAEGEFPENEASAAPALLCFTSGTTARPKGVVLTHANLRSNLHDLIQTWGWTRSDRLLLALPLFHVHGLGVGLHGWALTGCGAIVMEKFEPGEVLQVLTQSRTTLFMGVPTMYRRLQEAFEPGRHRIDLRLAITGSAPMSRQLHRACREMFGQTLLERYGMTETIMNTSNPLTGERKPGSVGKPLPSVQIRLRDEHLGEIEADHQTGEVWVRGPNVFSEYWRDPRSTQQAFANEWFRTGDLGYWDRDGYLFLQGRSSVDLIKSAGYRIGAREIEEVLEQHPGVREAAVVGLPDEDLGERVTACLVTHQSVEKEEILAFCRESLTLYKCPRQVVFLEALPKNAMGKVTKSRLKESLTIQAG